MLSHKPIEAVDLTQIQSPKGTNTDENQTDSKVAKMYIERLKLIVVPTPPRTIRIPSSLPSPGPGGRVVIRDPIQSTSFGLD